MFVLMVFDTIFFLFLQYDIIKILFSAMCVRENARSEVTADNRPNTDTFFFSFFFFSRRLVAWRNETHLMFNVCVSAWSGNYLFCLCKHLAPC